MVPPVKNLVFFYALGCLNIHKINGKNQKKSAGWGWQTVESMSCLKRFVLRAQSVTSGALLYLSIEREKINVCTSLSVVPPDVTNDLHNSQLVFP